MIPFDEIITHLGEERSKYFNAVAPPVIQSSNFAFDSIKEFQSFLVDESKHHVYSRGNNPSTEILRKKIAALEHCEDCIVVASGSAAVAVTVLSCLQAGDHVLCVEKPYSWTRKLFSNMLPRFGITTTYFDSLDSENIESFIQDNTKLIYLESPNSITYEIQNLSVVSSVAKRYGIITAIDNSYSSPIYQNPADFGIDLVIHSGTKYLNGHSDMMFGAICGSQALIKKIFDSEFMTLGAVLSPHDAVLALKGLRTLKIRLKESNKTTKKIIKYLKTKSEIKKIYYPFDKLNPQYHLAKKQMRGCGGLFSIELNVETKEEVNAFLEGLDKFLFAVSWGGYESLKLPTLAFYDIPNALNPPLPFQLIRLYIGLESIEYLIENFEKAFKILNNYSVKII
jgi:cystathionine beta-lyase